MSRPSPSLRWRVCCQSWRSSKPTFFGRPYFFAKLPLTNHASRVAGLFQDTSECWIVRVDFSESNVVSDIALSGHDLDSRGSAQGLHIGVVETHACLREFIEIRGFVGLAAIHSQTLLADVISQNQNDVWLFSVEGAMRTS